MRDYRADFLGVMAAFFPLSTFIAKTKHEATGRRPWYLPPFPERDAIPHHAAIGRGHQQRALPDRKIRLDGDAGNAEIIAPDEFVTFRHLFARKPRLAVPVDILTLVLADRARGRRRSAFGKLRAALLASP